MKIKEKAKETYSQLINMPPAEKDLEEFAKKILEEFIEELEKNAMSVCWNYGLDSVIFLDKDLNGKKSLKTIKEQYLGSKDQTGDSALP